MKYKKNDRVTHKEHGAGTVVAIFGGDMYDVLLDKPVRMNDTTYITWTSKEVNLSPLKSEPTELSTGDMLNELAKNPKAKYEHKKHGWKYIMRTSSKYFFLDVFDSNGELVKSHLGGGGFNGNILSDATWTLVKEPKPISFMEAIEAAENSPKFNFTYDPLNIECKSMSFGEIVSGIAVLKTSEEAARALREGQWYLI